MYEDILDYTSSGEVVGMELVGKDMINRWRMFIGPSDCKIAKVKAPETLRA